MLLLPSSSVLTNLTPSTRLHTTVTSDGNEHDGPTFCIQHFSCPWGCRTAGRRPTGTWCTQVSAQRDSRVTGSKKRSRFKFKGEEQYDADLKDHHLGSLQVDVLQIAVVEVEVTAISFLISELHQVCGREINTFPSITIYYKTPICLKIWSHYILQDTVKSFSLTQSSDNHLCNDQLSESNDERFAQPGHD